MTVVQFPVPPIVKTVTVRVPPAQAFALFAGDFARWWPLSQTTPVSTQWTVRSSRDWVDACSNGRLTGAKRRGGQCWRMIRRIVSPFPGS
jgi:hypothetical protein